MFEGIKALSAGCWRVQVWPHHSEVPEDAESFEITIYNGVSLHNHGWPPESTLYLTAVPPVTIMAVADQLLARESGTATAETLATFTMEPGFPSFDEAEIRLLARDAQGRLVFLIISRNTDVEDSVSGYDIDHETVHCQ